MQFLSSNQCATLVQDFDGVGRLCIYGTEGTGEISVLSTYSYHESKNNSRNKVQGRLLA